MSPARRVDDPDRQDLTGDAEVKTVQGDTDQAAAPGHGPVNPAGPGPGRVIVILCLLACLASCCVPGCLFLKQAMDPGLSAVAKPVPPTRSEPVALQATSAVPTNPPATTVKRTTPALPVPVQTMAAGFVFTPTTGNSPVQVSFTDNSTGPDVREWSWDFGDGTTSREKDPVHLYTQPGTFTVTLTISDSSSSWSRAIGFVRVKEPLAASFTTVVVRTGTVAFTDMSRGDPVRWQWDFGDGTTSEEKNPAHTFRQTQASYPVRLIVTSPDGRVAEGKKMVVIARG